MVIKGKIIILKWEDKQKVFFFVSQRLRQPVGEEKKGEKKRKKRKKRKEKTKKVGFHFGIMCFWISRLFGMDYWTFIWISMVIEFLI